MSFNVMTPSTTVFFICRMACRELIPRCKIIDIKIGQHLARIIIIEILIIEQFINITRLILIITIKFGQISSFGYLLASIS